MCVGSSLTKRPCTAGTTWLWVVCSKECQDNFRLIDGKCVMVSETVCGPLIASSAVVLFMHVVHCLLCCSCRFTAGSAAAASTLAHLPPQVPFPSGAHH